MWYLCVCVFVCALFERTRDTAKDFLLGLGLFNSSGASLAVNTSYFSQAPSSSCPAFSSSQVRQSLLHWKVINILFRVESAMLSLVFIQRAQMAKLVAESVKSHPQPEGLDSTIQWLQSEVSQKWTNVCHHAADMFGRTSMVGSSRSLSSLSLSLFAYTRSSARAQLPRSPRLKTG